MISTAHAYFFRIGRSGLLETSAIETLLHETYGMPEHSLAFYEDGLGELELATVWRSQELINLFRYGVVSILQEENEWLKTFTEFKNQADKVAKAMVLLNLHSFFSRSSIYQDEDYLMELVTNGHFFNRRFYFVYLYEFISKNYPLSALKQHGRNYVSMFGSRELVYEILNGQAMKVFQAGLMDNLSKMVMNSEFKAIYKEFFEVAYQDQNKISPVSKSQFKDEFVSALAVESDSRDFYDELLEAVGF